MARLHTAPQTGQHPVLALLSAICIGAVMLHARAGTDLEVEMTVLCAVSQIVNHTVGDARPTWRVRLGSDGIARRRVCAELNRD